MQHQIQSERQAAVYVLAIIRELWSAERRAPLRLKDVADRFTALHADGDQRVTPKWIGGIIRKHLGLKPYRTHGVYVLYLNNAGKLGALSKTFALESGRREIMGTLADVRKTA